MPKQTQLFIDRETAIPVRVESVNARYANIVVMTKLTSRFAMPIAQYDGDAAAMQPGVRSFVEKYRPVPTGKIPIDTQFRMPENAHLWDEEDAQMTASDQETVAQGEADVTATTAAKTEPPPDDSRGETEEGVVIGGES